MRVRQCLEWPLMHACAYHRLGINLTRGVILYGPPGCSKTTLMRAIASSTQARTILLSASGLFSMCACCCNRTLYYLHNQQLMTRSAVQMNRYVMFCNIQLVSWPRSHLAKLWCRHDKHMHKATYHKNEK